VFVDYLTIVHRSPFPRSTRGHGIVLRGASRATAITTVGGSCDARAPRLHASCVDGGAFPVP
jgi:hypothetical protein